MAEYLHHDDRSPERAPPLDPARGRPSGADAEGEGGIGGAVRSFVRAAVGAAGRAGSVSLSTLGDALEGPGRALSARTVASVVDAPRPVADRSELADALEEQPRAPLLGGATGAALATRVARKVGPLRFLARRTPMWLVITAVPALHASASRGSDELALVASHLVHRARAAGVQPDPDRVRRAAVQLLSEVRVDPAVEPRHAPLATAWLQRAVRATLPFSPGVVTRNPAALARATAAVDPATLAAPPEIAAGDGTEPADRGR